MRRGGQLSSEGGVCGDGRRGGIGIPSIAVVAGSIGSLRGQSRYRSGALALFHSLGAQRSAVLGHIVNGVRLGLRSRCLHGYFKKSNLSIAFFGDTCHGVTASDLVFVTKCNRTVLGHQRIGVESQQAIFNFCASSYLKANSCNVNTINNNICILVTVVQSRSIALPCSIRNFIVNQTSTIADVLLGSVYITCIISHISFAVSIDHSLIGHCK